MDEIILEICVALYFFFCELVDGLTLNLNVERIFENTSEISLNK